jgi:hypothetical protein
MTADNPIPCSEEFLKLAHATPAMAGPFETIYYSILDAAGFFSNKPAAIALEFAKVAAIGMIIQVAFIFLMMGLGIATGGASATDAMMIVFVVAAVLLAIAFFIATTAVSATPYCMVDNMLRGKERAGIIRRTKELLPAVAGYCAIMIGLFVLVVGFAMGSVLLFGGDAILTIIPMIAALCVILGAVYAFQFALPKIALEGMDAIGALKASYAIVRKDMWTVLLFDIILVIVLFGIVLVLSLPQGAIESQMVAAGTDVTVVALLLAAYVIFSIIETVVISLIAVNLIYFFMMRLGSIPPVEAPVAPSKKRAARR